MSETTATKEITVYADYVCPFCYLGRTSLAEYQSSREEPLPIDWRPFDLRAGKRTEDGEIDRDADDGKDEAYYEQARQNVRRLREEYGADEMATEMATEVDSLNAQIASYYVKDEHPESWRAFDDSIYAALWEDERDIGDPDVLADLAEDAGLDPAEIRDVIDDEDHRKRVREAFTEAQQRGITGVPTFVYDGHAARGAVPPEHIERLVEGSD